jgi:hypothetical protein
VLLTAPDGTLRGFRGLDLTTCCTVVCHPVLLYAAPTSRTSCRYCRQCLSGGAVAVANLYIEVCYNRSGTAPSCTQSQMEAGWLTQFPLTASAPIGQCCGRVLSLWGPQQSSSAVGRPLPMTSSLAADRGWDLWCVYRNFLEFHALRLGPSPPRQAWV